MQVVVHQTRAEYPCFSFAEAKNAALDELGPFGPDDQARWGKVAVPAVLTAARGRSPAPPSPVNSRTPPPASLASHSPPPQRSPRCDDGTLHDVVISWNPGARYRDLSEVPPGAEVIVPAGARVCVLKTDGAWAYVETRSRTCFDRSCADGQVLPTGCAHARVLCMLPKDHLRARATAPPPPPPPPPPPALEPMPHRFHAAAGTPTGEPVGSGGGSSSGGLGALAQATSHARRLTGFVLRHASST